MGDESTSYSALSPDEQAAVSVWIEGFEARLGQLGPGAIEQTLGEAPAGLRVALLSQLVPVAIDAYRHQHGVTPTLHELRLSHPDLASELSEVYSGLPASYQLPVELGGYRVIRVVGDGGQAVVLRAQDDVHSTVAIKLSTSPRHNELLLRERGLLGECEHPGIVPVIGSGMHEGSAYYVMPYLKGVTLADRYGIHRPEASEAARIGVELCRIVEHLHGQGILHRDIKPANVWIDDHGAVKLIDLGMAVERSQWGQPLSQLREFHGTPAFMSPEQAASDGEQDGELSDVFSIGATLYWLGTGSAPFDGSSGESVLSKAATGQFDRDRLAMVAGWPKPVIKACLRAMAAEPSQRYRSAGALQETLEASRLASQASLWKGVALLLLVLLVTALIVPYSRKELLLLLSRRPDSVGQKEKHEPVAPVEQTDTESVEVKPGSASKTEPEPAEGNLNSMDPPPKVDPSVVRRPVHAIYQVPEPRVATYEVEQFINSTTPNFPAAPDIEYLSPLEPRCAKARAWLAALPAGTKMGHLAGIRFHPTVFIPIALAISSIEVFYKSRQSEGAAPVQMTLTRINPGHLSNAPIWVYEGITRPLTRDDRTEYATDTSESPVPMPNQEVMQVPPGLASVAFYAKLRDGSRTPTYEVLNDDFTLAKQVFPQSEPPQGYQLDAYVFLYRTATMDRSNGLVRFLKKPLDADSPFRGRMERTRFGFYVTPPEGVRSITVADSFRAKRLIDGVKPGPIYVTYRFPDVVVGPIRFEVPRERFVELAEDALIYSKRYHAN